MPNLSGTALPEDMRKVAMINANAVAADGTLEPLSKQVALFYLAKEAGEDPRDFTPFVVCANGSAYGVPALAGKPLLLTNAVLKHVVKKHDFRWEAIDLIADELANNLLVFQRERDPSKYVFVLNAASRDGNRMISVVEAQAQSYGIAVTQIRSIHGKRDLVGQMRAAIEDGREFYTNERTGELIRGLRVMERDDPLVRVVLEHLSRLDDTRKAAQGQAVGELARPAAPAPSLQERSEAARGRARREGPSEAPSASRGPRL